MSRTQLFSQGFSIIMRSGPMWLVALAAAGINFAISRVLPGNVTIVWTIINTARSMLTGAFVTGALITLANAAAEGQFLSVKEGFRAGIRPYLRLVCVDLILIVPTMIISLIEGPIRYQINPNPTSADWLANLPLGFAVLFCCLAPILLVGILLAAGLGVGAERAITLEALGIGPAFARGWNLLKAKFSDFVVIGLIMLAVGLALGILFGCALVMVGLASSVSASAGNLIASYGSSLITTITVGLVIIMLEVYFSTVWTLAFRRWQGKDLPMVEPAVVPPVNFLPGA